MFSNEMVVFVFLFKQSSTTHTYEHGEWLYVFKSLKKGKVFTYYSTLYSMHTFKGAFKKLPWLSSDLNTQEPSQAPGGYIHRCFQTIFPGTHKAETIRSQVLILRLREPSPL